MRTRSVGLSLKAIFSGVCLALIFYPFSLDGKTSLMYRTSVLIVWYSNAKLRRSVWFKTVTGRRLRILSLVSFYLFDSAFLASPSSFLGDDKNQI
jgi:hypothetical protein